MLKGTCHCGAAHWTLEREPFCPEIMLYIKR